MKPDQWRALADMKMRRLDREYEAVLAAEIKTDPNKFEGLAKVLGVEKESQQALDNKENCALADNNNPEASGESDDGFGDF